MASTEVAEHPSDMATTERGALLRVSWNTVNVGLKLLALNGGHVSNTVKMLEEEGIEVNRETLRRWKDTSFPRRYQQLRGELATEITDETAARLYERALESDEATKAYIEAALQKIDKVSPTHLAKNAAALAQATSTSVQTAELLRGKPTSIVEHRSLADMVGTLEKLGVAKVEAIDVESTEEPA